MYIHIDAHTHTHTYAHAIEILVQRISNRRNGKEVEISGIEIVNGQKAFVMRFLQLGGADDVSGGFGAGLSV